MLYDSTKDSDLETTSYVNKEINTIKYVIMIEILSIKYTEPNLIVLGKFVLFYCRII